MNRTLAAVVAGLALTSVLAGPAAALGQGALDQTTASAGDTRSGWVSQAAPLSASQFSAGRFSRIFRTPVEGRIRGQPLLFQGDVFVTTDLDIAYRVDGATGRVKWRQAVGRPQPAGPGQSLDCEDVQPSLGVLSTPAIDTRTGTMYLTARDWDGGEPASAGWLAHALAAADGRELAGWPVRLAGTSANDQQAVLDGARQLQRPALLLQHGSLWIGLGGVCNRFPYRGWLAAIDLSSRALQLWTDAAGDPGGGGGIWQAGGGLVADGTDGILLATGNGPPQAGPAQPYLAESVLRLRVGGQPLVQVVDAFTAPDAGLRDRLDADLGSGNPLPLAAEFAGGSGRRLLLQVSKTGTLYLLDRDHLGTALWAGDAATAVFGHPAQWPGDRLIFVAQTPFRLPDRPAQLDARLRAYSVSWSGGSPQVVEVGRSGDQLEYGSGSPLVTSDWTRSGSALVWLIARQGTLQNGRAELRVYEARPRAGLLQLRLRQPLGSVGPFANPVTDGRSVYLGTDDGGLLGFTEQPAPATSPAVGEWLLASVSGVALVLVVALLVARGRRSRQGRR